MDLDPYPAFRQLLASAPEWKDDLTLDRAVNGDVRGRSFYTHKRRVFTLSHALSLAEYAQLENFYDANRNNRVTMTWCQTGSQHVCLFDGPPSKPDYPSPDIAMVKVTLAEQ
jgi:hypothetical protein